MLLGVSHWKPQRKLSCQIVNFYVPSLDSLYGVLREIIQVVNVVSELFYGTESGNGVTLYNDSRASTWVSVSAGNTIWDKINR